MTRPALQFSQALGHDAADKRLDILRRIGQVGSISEAARGAGVSYKAAWQAIETLSNLAGQALVEKAVGGSGGGGARLTPAGQRLLQAAELFAQARASVLSRLDHDSPGGIRPADLLGLGLRTSMRNQLPCRVSALESDAAQVRVTLDLADGRRLHSRITGESAELLGLVPGLPVIALCKATAVTVADVLAPRPGVNLLHGTVGRISAAQHGSEVSLQLLPGLHLVGFTPAGVALQPGQPAMAAVDESAVVIAVGE